MMVRISQRSVTQDDRDAYARFVENDPSDDNTAQFIRERFARLDPDTNQIFKFLKFWLTGDHIFKIKKISHNYETILQNQFSIIPYISNITSLRNKNKATWQQCSSL